MRNPRISIITPSYNQGEYIEETICSVLEQGYKNLEYIIIDGGSSDKSVDIIRKYQNHLSYWESSRDDGQSHAISKGLSRASGEVINWLNSDDFLERDSLKLIGEVFEDPEINVFGGLSRIFGIGESRNSKGTDIYLGNLEKTIALARIDQPETFFRKSTWIKVGGINRHYHYLMDKELWIRYLLMYGLSGVYRSNDILANFRLHAESKTVSKKNRFDFEEANLYYSLFSHLGNQRAQRYLRARWNAHRIPSTFTSGSANPDVIASYFFLREIQKAYREDDDRQFDHLLNEIDVKYLSKSDIQLFSKLCARRKIIPAAFRPKARMLFSNLRLLNEILTK